MFRKSNITNIFWLKIHKQKARKKICGMYHILNKVYLSLEDME